jgi:hypothetical protein
MNILYTATSAEQNFEQLYLQKKRQGFYREAIRLILEAPDKAADMIYQSELGYLYSETGDFHLANENFKLIQLWINRTGVPNIAKPVLQHISINNMFYLFNKGNPADCLREIWLHRNAVNPLWHPKKDFYMAQVMEFDRHYFEATKLLWDYYSTHFLIIPGEGLERIGNAATTDLAALQFSKGKMQDAGLTNHFIYHFIQAGIHFKEGNYYEASIFYAANILSSTSKETQFICFLRAKDCFSNLNLVDDLKAHLEKYLPHFLADKIFHSNIYNTSLEGILGSINPQNRKLQAVRLFIIENILPLAPDSDELLALKTLKHAYCGQMETVLEALATVQQKAAFSVMESRIYAQCAFMLKDYREALSYLHRLNGLPVNQANYYYWAMEVNCYFQLKDYDNCIAECRVQLRHWPGSVTMKAMLAQACFQKGEKKEAQQIIENAIKEHPFEAEFYLIQGEFEGREGNKDNALADTLKGIFLAFGSVEGHEHIPANLAKFTREPLLLQSYLYYNGLYETYQYSLNPAIRFSLTGLDGVNAYTGFCKTVYPAQSMLLHDLLHATGQDYILTAIRVKDHINRRDFTIHPVLLYWFHAALRRFNCENHPAADYTREFLRQIVKQQKPVTVRDYPFLQYLAENLAMGEVQQYLANAKDTFAGTACEVYIKLYNNQSAPAVLEAVCRHQWGHDAEADSEAITDYAICTEFLTASLSSAESETFLRLFKNTDPEFFWKAIRHDEIKRLISLFTGNWQTQLQYENTELQEAEIDRLRRLFINNDLKAARGVYLSLEKAAAGGGPDFEEELAREITAFDLKFGEAYFQLVKLFYLQGRLTIQQMMYLVFYTIETEKKKGIKSKKIQDSIEKGSEEFVKTILKLFASSAATHEGKLPEAVSIVITTVAAALSKAFHVFMKTETNTFLDTAPAGGSKYRKFRDDFIAHIGFLHETLGPERFHSIYCVEFSSLVKQ